MSFNLIERLEQRTMLAATPIVDPNAPIATIVRPVGDLPYHVGQKIRFNGAASDRQDGKLDGSSLRWTITRHVGDEVSVLRRLKGAGGTLIIPQDTPGAADQFFRLTLRALDSSGRRDVETFDLKPRTAGLTLDSTLDGVRLRLDGRRVTEGEPTPSLVGSERLVRAPRFQVEGGILYEFARWSDGGKRTHAVDVHFVDQTLTALYVPAGPAPVEVAAPATSRAFSDQRIAPEDGDGLFG